MKEVKLEIENIGKIEKSQIQLAPITVIGGENDSGKSTVGKVIFSIVKGIKKYQEGIWDRVRVKNKIRELSFKYSHLFLESEDWKELRKLFLTLERYPALEGENLYQFIEKYIQTFPSELKKIFEKEILKPLPRRLLQERALSMAFYSEFHKELLKLKESRGKIKFGELELEIENGKISILHPDSEMPLEMAIPFEKATLIETPLILNFAQLISHASFTIEEELLSEAKSIKTPITPYHSKDLVNKLKFSSELIWFEEYEKDKKRSKLETILQKFGDLKFDFEEEEFKYIRKGERFSILNSADGVKSFLILQTLLKGDFLNFKHLLIIDEPEVHLHPKWQIIYGKILIEIAEEFGNPVLITTHSPYMLEILQLYSRKREVPILFYLAKNGEIKEAKMEEIYSRLVEPLDELEELEVEVEFMGNMGKRAD
jgi:predicted ATPase